MVLTETIRKSINAINLRREMTDDKIRAESYGRIVSQLPPVAKEMKDILECAAELKARGIVSDSVITAEDRSDLLTCIDSCGRGLSEAQISQETVKLLQSKGNAIADSLKIIWKDAAQKYAEGATGYLSMIAGLTDNPGESRELVHKINTTMEASPSVRAISKLVKDVASAQKITEGFSISPHIEIFLKKVSSQRATVADLTPDIIAWLKEKRLMGKLKVRF